MSWWLWGIGIYTLAIAVFTLVWMLLGAVRHHREAEERALMLQNEALLCAWMLREIVAQSYRRDHRGTWQAWAGTMGVIDVQLKAFPIDGKE